MITAYFDSSALVKTGLDEPGADVVRSLWDVATFRCTSRLGQVEVAAATSAALRSRRLSPAGFRRATEVWGGLATRLVVLDLVSTIASEASRMAGLHRLSGADAVHLASALRLGPGTVFACWDTRLRAAALAEGLVLSPPEIGHN